MLLTRFRDLPDEPDEAHRRLRGGGAADRRAADGDACVRPEDRVRPIASYSWNNKEWDGGFGRQVLGETWINHHGRHKVQSTRGIFAAGRSTIRSCAGIRSGEIWGPTDVYTVRQPLPDMQPLVLGAVLGVDGSGKRAGCRQRMSR